MVPSKSVILVRFVHEYSVGASSPVSKRRLQPQPSLVLFGHLRTMIESVKPLTCSSRPHREKFRLLGLWCTSGVNCTSCSLRKEVGLWPTWLLDSKTSDRKPELLYVHPDRTDRHLGRWMTSAETGSHKWSFGEWRPWSKSCPVWLLWSWTGRFQKHPLCRLGLCHSMLHHQQVFPHTSEELHTCHQKWQLGER